MAEEFGFIKKKEPEDVPEGAVPAYLLDREGVSRSKVLSNMIKQKRKEKAGKWQVPIPKVRAMTEDEMFKIMRSGKRKKKARKAAKKAAKRAAKMQKKMDKLEL